MSIRHAMEFEDKAVRDEAVSDADIHLSRLTGIAPSDIDHLVDFSREEGLLVIIRCPKRPARYFHGKHQPKTLATSLLGLKSDGATGLVTLPDGTKQVSDYDLMCVYRYYGADGYQKISFTGVDPSNKRSPLPREATALMGKINWRLKSRFQHGAQDDLNTEKHPNVSNGGGTKLPDRFAVFNLGNADYYPNPEELRRDVYERLGLDWPYDSAGVHRSAKK